MIARSDRPGRVLMTADTVGGVWTYAIELAAALGAEGVEVILATMGAAVSPEQRREARSVATLELAESRYRLPWMEDPWTDVAASKDWLIELADQTGPSVIHLNDPVHGSAPWAVPTVAVVHSCVLSWWQAVWNTPAPPTWNRYADEMSRGLAGVDEIVTPSSSMLRALQRFYGISRGRVIPNGRDPRGFSPGPKAPLVFAAGRLWDPAKNLSALDRVAPQLSWPVYVAGDCSAPGQDQEICLEHLRRLGRLPCSAIAAWLGRAAIYAFPARYEPFGLSVLEAALSGCALVLGDLPSLRDLWDGVAVFVPPDDTEALGAALEALIQDACLRQVLGARARRRALGFTPRRMAHDYIELYSALLAGRESSHQGSACAS